MSLLTGVDRSFLSAVSLVAYENPFSPELRRHERQALGREYVEDGPVWSMDVEDPDRPRRNHWRLRDRLRPVLAKLRERLLTGAESADNELVLYEDAVLFFLYYEYFERIRGAAFATEASASSRDWSFYDDFQSDWDFYLTLPGVRFPTGHEAPHTFACFYQIVRAFRSIFEHIIGSSTPAARLRATVWQSIFTRDIRRYRREYYNRMADFTTLITGPSGTGKELVARAIALSRYLPFEASKKSFALEPEKAFHPINIAALPPTLVESELFGHRKGSFTGAVENRLGRLESCPSEGSVFLDEVGDLSPEIQVKLLRVIETRCFQPIGESADRRFDGKLIAATNCDLAMGTENGGFREDLYYRLCSDLIETPSLQEQIKETPEVLRELVLFMARRTAGVDAETLADEAENWILENLGPDYRWPGNYRELEQCIRNLMIRGDYRPIRGPRPATDELFAELAQGAVTADELLSRYCTWVYFRTGSYQETARRLAVDRRTVKSKVDGKLLALLRSNHGAEPFIGHRRDASRWWEDFGRTPSASGRYHSQPRGLPFSDRPARVTGTRSR